MELPRKKTRLWPGMIFALIGLNFCVVGLTVVAARARHSSFAVEADYDRKALHWEDTARQRTHNAELGWTVRVDRVEGGRLAVAILDKSGAAISGASVNVEAFHHARAGTRIETLLGETPNGYEGAVAIDLPGLWELRFTVRHGTDTFTAALTRAMTGGARS